MSASLSGLRYRAITALSTQPEVFYSLRRISGRSRAQTVQPDTEIVIEGFPRSANSTTVHDFLERQERPVRVAHHLHHAAQLVRAARWEIPAIALIRPPRPAVLSFLALAEEARRRGDGPGRRLSIEDAICGWLAFYGTARRYREALLLAPFDWVTADLEGVIEALNARFGTAFHATPVVRTPQPSLGWHARANDLRRRIGEELEAEFDAACRLRRVRENMRRADDLYAAMMAGR